MKRKILSKLAAFAILALTACSFVNNSELKDDTTETFITIGLADTNRTALPDIRRTEEFTGFTLIGSSTAEDAVAVIRNWETDSSSSAYAKMAASNIIVTEGAEYNFTLTGTKGGTTWQGNATKVIKPGNNQLSFSLSMQTLSTEGTGALNVTLTVPNVVKAAEAELKTLDEANTIYPKGAAFSFKNNKAVYSADEICGGYYVLIFKLYGDAEKKYELAQWREFAEISDGNTSTSTPVIESAEKLKKIYTVTFMSNGGSAVTSKTVTGGNTVAKPEDPTREPTELISYSFAGWYLSVNNGRSLSAEPFDFSTGISDSITLCAKWNESRCYKVRFLYEPKDTDPAHTKIVKEGDTVESIITEKADSLTKKYIFEGWYLSNEDGTQYISDIPFDFNTPVVRPISLLAKYNEINIYNVRIEKNEHGTITANKITGIETGNTVTLTITPYKGYKIGTIYTGTSDVSIIEADRGTYTFTMPSHNVSIYVSFLIEYIGPKTPNEQKNIGDIIFSDGSASPNTAILTEEQKAEAAAIVFDTEKKLAVGLNTAMKLKWNSKSALVNSEEYQFEYQFDDDDGFANTSYIASLSDYNAENYPAFYFCTSYSTSGYTKDWYLPALNEIKALYENRESITNSFSALEKDDPFARKNSLMELSYWTSTKTYFSALSYGFGLVKGKRGMSPYSGNNVCAIRKYE